MDLEKSDLSIFIDESGSITKNDIKHHKYFIIAILCTKNSKKLKTQFRKGISSLIKNPKFEKILKENGEIKGTEVTETQKFDVYERIVRRCKDEFEIGIIVLDNNYTTNEFIKNHARTFNYILQMYFDNLFRSQSMYIGSIKDIYMIIDEQNIATDADYTLVGYLNQHLNLINPICNHFDVKYSDSKNHLLIQLIDFISNTFYRNIEKHDRTSIKNIHLLMDNLCGGKFFDFSPEHDTKLFLDE